MKRRFLTIAAAGLISVGVVDQVLAKDSDDPIVKCYGIAKSGSNDCADANAKHGCAGQSAIDYDPCEWKAVTRSECQSGIKDANKTVVGTEKPENCQSSSDPEGEADAAAEKESAPDNASNNVSSDASIDPSSPSISANGSNNEIETDVIPQRNSDSSKTLPVIDNEGNVNDISAQPEGIQQADSVPNAAADNTVTPGTVVNANKAVAEQQNTENTSTSAAVSSSSSVGSAE